MTENLATVSDLGGAIEFVSSGPFAVGDPLFSIDEHIRITERAETTRFDGRTILYQRYHLCSTDQIPGYDGDPTDEASRRELERYLQELEGVIDEYPETVNELTSIQAEHSSVVVHGALQGAYNGEGNAEVTRLPPHEERTVRHELERTLEGEPGWV